ncbi:uncharacterized protein LACBIDRAFT_327512 [Laccaria bicolor S238N-H82]|uniref:Predicted protein n=1 Tax=Laccaria bicolor (strain S238N-H82 / ATCC MYA-4686) TaxID=486041 RepID=B0DBZ1_LACBS|nr:uncharacterized protein LACBIDRAFT_327512 [Laccaria bicolor S238N-H82]EDR07802.1 predicted protein [Laccaria bicolor S238N-H82]|eukprot:XP_001881591.1 predicted protein [Laccaria bicolor S238N-H82]
MLMYPSLLASIWLPGQFELTSRLRREEAAAKQSQTFQRGKLSYIVSQASQGRCKAVLKVRRAHHLPKIQVSSRWSVALCNRADRGAAASIVGSVAAAKCYSSYQCYQALIDRDWELRSIFAPHLPIETSPHQSIHGDKREGHYQRRCHITPRHENAPPSFHSLVSWANGDRKEGEAKYSKEDERGEQAVTAVVLGVSEEKSGGETESGIDKRHKWTLQHPQVVTRNAIARPLNTAARSHRSFKSWSSTVLEHNPMF